MAAYGGVIKRTQILTTTAAQQPDEIRERRTAAEDVLGGLLSDIGKPGTYELPGPVSPDSTVDVVDSTAPTGVIDGSAGLLTKDGFKFTNKGSVAKYDKLIKEGYSSKEAANLTPGTQAADSIFNTKKTVANADFTANAKQTNRTNLGGLTKTTSLNKEAALNQIESSSAFRQVSRMMAESEQMLSRSGPLYNEMMRSTQLPILEGSAVLARENTENIRKALQRGGAARRDGFAAIAKIRSQEASNMAKGQALARAHTEMDLWARKNAKETIDFANGWASNQAGIRESYQSAMDNATELMSTSALPFMFASLQKEQEYRDAKSAQSRNNVMRQVSAVVGVVGAVLSAYSGSGEGVAASGKLMKDEGTKIDQTVLNNQNNYYTATPSNAPEAPSTLGGDIRSAASGVANKVTGAYNYVTGGWGS